MDCIAHGVTKSQTRLSDFHFHLCIGVYRLCVFIITYGNNAEMGSIKDRNGMDLTEAKDIKKRWQEYTELYKKDLHDPDNHNDVITYLEPEILECEVK